MKPKILHVGLCVQPPPYNGLQKAFIENSSEYHEINCGAVDVNKQIVDLTKWFKPDLVFMQVQTPGVIHLNTVKHLRDIKAYVINWNGDIRENFPGWMMQLGPYVHTMFSNMRDVHHARLAGIRADFLEIGYDPEIYKPSGRVNVDVKPIVFFGNNVHAFPMSRFRKEACLALKNTFPNKVGVYGSHAGSDGNFNHSQREEAAAYRNAKIAINISHFEVEQYTSDRMFRILGTGVPLCLAKQYPGIERQFTDQRHLITFNTIDEMLQQVEFFLHRPDIAKPIIKAGHELALREYTFDAMVKRMIKFYNER